MNELMQVTIENRSDELFTLLEKKESFDFDCEQALHEAELLSMKYEEDYSGVICMLKAKKFNS
jgi:hypothetical protein